MREEKMNLKGKVVTVNNGIKEPLREALVQIEGGASSDTLAKSVSDVYGDFELRIPNNDTSYTIKATPKDKNTKNVMLLTQEGKEISYLQKTFREFEYKLMKADILEMA